MPDMNNKYCFPIPIETIVFRLWYAAKDFSLEHSHALLIHQLSIRRLVYVLKVILNSIRIELQNICVVCWQSLIISNFFTCLISSSQVIPKHAKLARRHLRPSMYRNKINRMRSRSFVQEKKTKSFTLSSFEFLNDKEKKLLFPKKSKSTLNQNSSSLLGIWGWIKLICWYWILKRGIN